MTTNVPPIQFTAAGLVLPLEADILAGVQADYNAAFGGALNNDLTTPQGQLASSTTAIVGDVNSTFALFVNNINPDLATGFMQDAIARIYFLTRLPATATVVQCNCVGLAGTIIPVGALAQDTSGNNYACTQAGTIPVGGTVSLPFTNLVTGPIACPAGTLSIVAQTIPGWDVITNPTAGVPGSDVETPQAFEYRRKNSVARNARGTVQAIFANVFEVPGVLDCYVIDNPLGTVVNKGATNYPMAPHSVYVAVVGGVSTDIANAIWLAKDVGCDMNGNTTVIVSDTNGYNPPYPTYQIKFNTPTNTPIKFAIQIQNNALLPSDIIVQTQNAVLAAFNGTDGGSRARIGSSLFASRYYAGIAAISPNVAVISVLLGAAAPTLLTLTLGIDQAPTLTASDISVTLV